MHEMTDIDTPNLVIWPKWCYANNLMESEAQDLVLNNNNNNNANINNNTLHLKEKSHSGLCASSRNRKKLRKETPNGASKELVITPLRGLVNGMQTDPAGDVKAERLSPDPASEVPNLRRVSPTPSTSPKSPASHRTRTPSYTGNSPNPAFTPPSTIHSPYDRFSPASLGAMSGLPGGHGAIKHMENLMTRNCSDLMRSLAAKYNNSNPNDYFSNPNNGFLRSPLQNIPSYKGAPSPFLGVPPHSMVSAVRETEKKPEPPVSSSLPQNLSSPGGPPPLFTNPAGIPGFPGFPLVDMSSTQVLLNMVRNASAAQQSQLENYLRGAMKRPADAPSSPLDLSSSVAAKRPRTEVSRSFDVKNLFSIVTEEDKKFEEKVSSPSSPSLAKTRPLSSPGYKSTFTIPCNDKNCPTLEGILHWTVEDVCAFVGSIDLCAEYVEAFREQRIDGAALPLLTEEHLTTSINMKLGPALKLKSVLARKLGACNICLHCNHCHSMPVDRRPNSASSGQ